MLFQRLIKNIFISLLMGIDIKKDGNICINMPCTVIVLRGH